MLDTQKENFETILKLWNYLCDGDRELKNLGGEASKKVLESMSQIKEDLREISLGKESLENPDRFIAEHSHVFSEKDKRFLQRVTHIKQEVQKAQKQALFYQFLHKEMGQEAQLPVKGGSSKRKNLSVKKGWIRT